MLKFSLIAAVCNNLGIGRKGDMPWKLRSEPKYFGIATKTLGNPKKRNAIIMGRKTYFKIPVSKRPLAQPLHIVLSNTLKPVDLPNDVLLYPNLKFAVKFLEMNGDIKDEIETVWLGGGSGSYSGPMATGRVHRVYLTKMQSNFDCDAFFPALPVGVNEVTLHPDTLKGAKKEDNLKYENKISEKQ